MIFEYLIIFIDLFLAIFLSLLFIFLSYFLVYQESYNEKITVYECGFQPFEDSRNIFDVKFYLVAILFIIFDLEIMFLFPWSVSLFVIDINGFFSMYLFLFLLTLGFVYEWKKGALDWD